MEKIYCDAMCEPRTEDDNGLFLKFASMQDELRKKLNKDDFKSWIFKFHNYIRKELGLPNKVFSFATTADKTKAGIILFPKEPDGNHYKAYYDEEAKLFYILVEEK